MVKPKKLYDDKVAPEKHMFVKNGEKNKGSSINYVRLLGWRGQRNLMPMLRLHTPTTEKSLRRRGGPKFHK